MARPLWSRLVLFEIGNALSKKRYRKAAVRLLTALENDPTVEIAGISDDLYRRGLSLFQTRLDKEWGLVDCVSFSLMAELDLSEALTADNHFEQAGFRALLREQR